MRGTIDRHNMISRVSAMDGSILPPGLYVEDQLYSQRYIDISESAAVAYSMLLIPPLETQNKLRSPSSGVISPLSAFSNGAISPSLLGSLQGLSPLSSDPL